MFQGSYFIVNRHKEEKILALLDLSTKILTCGVSPKKFHMKKIDREEVNTSNPREKARTLHIEAKKKYG